MPKKKINIAVIGATGYTGLDLIYLLSKHQKVKILYLCATKNLGKKISYFDKRLNNKLPKVTSVKKIEWEKIDLAFLSLPNGEAQKLIKKFYQKYYNVKFIDLSADFRIKDPKTYYKNYKLKHKAKSLAKDSIYAISEFVKKEIKDFRLVANPGCYPTSVQIPLMPLIKKRMIKLNNIIIDAKSGYSGAGKNLEKKFTHKNLYKSIFAYSVKGHRHSAEIHQELSKLTKSKLMFSFNPQIIPTFRGILTSIYINLNGNYTAEKVRKTLINFYKNDTFVKVLKLNSNLGTGNVINTNKIEISICKTRVKNKLVIFSSLDNLIKGASGQAIQNMNLMFKFPETMALK